MDYLLNGVPRGDVATRLLRANFDPRVLRPFVGDDGASYIDTLNQHGEAETLVTNAPATLRQDEWRLIDQAVVGAARPALRAWADLRAAASVTIPNAMGHPTFEYQTIDDEITGAEISMDGLAKSLYDRPEFGMAGIPLPIIHKDFAFSIRDIAISRNRGTNLDTTMAELAGRKVAEEVEKLTIGTSTKFSSFVGYNIYGMTTLPGRNTKTLTAPTGANNNVVVDEVLEMRQQLYDDYHMGPYVLYLSPNWDLYLDSDYSTTKGDNTLRDRIMAIDGISAIRTLPYLSGTQAIMIQMTGDVGRALIGLDVTTLQWESHGGLLVNFKVMAILVPQFRVDNAGQSGIVHGSV